MDTAALSYDEALHPVCVHHLAWIPCRHGSDADPCAWRDDAAAQAIVSDYHAGRRDRADALAAITATAGPLP